MAIKNETITSDITLELDEREISLADFNAACEAFSGLIKEVSRHVQPHAIANKAWTVKVYDGSAGVGVSAQPLLMDVATMNLIRSLLMAGMEQLGRGLRPDGFTDRAIEFARHLANAFKNSRAEPRIRIWGGRESAVPVGATVAATAKALLDPAYEEDGSVEGRLEKLDGHSKSQFVIYDLFDDRSIKCEVNEEILAQAWQHWKQRIEVIGRVRYRRDGHPVSVKAQQIIPFPGPDEIPSLEEMRRLLA